MTGATLMSSGFGKRLRDLRTRANMTQEALARAADVSLATVAKLEHGQSEPNWTTVLAIAKALGVSVAEFEANDGRPAEREEQPEGTKKQRRPKK